jgi:hypothetical protein
MPKPVFFREIQYSTFMVDPIEFQKSFRTSVPLGTISWQLPTFEKKIRALLQVSDLISDGLFVSEN